MRSKFRIKRPRVWDDIKTITLPRYFGSGGKLSLRSGKFARDDITRFGMSGRILTMAMQVGFALGVSVVATFVWLASIIWTGLCAYTPS